MTKFVKQTIFFRWIVSLVKYGLRCSTTKQHACHCTWANLEKSEFKTEIKNTVLTFLLSTKPSRRCFIFA